jgi:rhodanese-related sulfurtransferase
MPKILHTAQRRSSNPGHAAWRLASPLAAALALGLAASGAQAERGAGDGLAPLQALQALADGAVILDLRRDGALPAGAVRLDADAWRAWAERGDLQALSRAVSNAGLNLSARVLVAGDADDAATAQAARRLAGVASGRVQWLAGGVPAWQAAGLPTQPAPAARLPLPQRLVAYDTPVDAGPADVARRGSTTYALAQPVQQLASAPGR